MKPRDFQQNNLVLRAGAPFGPAGRDRWRCGATVCAAALFVVGCGNSGESPGTAIGSDGGGGLDGTAGAGGVGFGGAGGAGGEAADAALFGSGGQGGGNGGGGGGQAGATARDAAADGGGRRDCRTGVYEGSFECVNLRVGAGYDVTGTATITVGPEVGGQARITVDVDAKDIRGGLTVAELTASAEGTFDCIKWVRFTGGSAHAVAEGVDVDLSLRLMGNPGGSTGSIGAWVGDPERRWNGFLIWIQSEDEEPPTCAGDWATLPMATSP